MAFPLPGLNERPQGTQYQLFEAASSGDLAGVEAALAEGAGLNARDRGEFGALAFAVREGQLAVVLYLLEQGVEVKSIDLLVAGASAYSSPTILKLLQLAQIRQVKPETRYQSEAEARLLNAAWAGDLGSVYAAIHAGANVNVSDDQDTAALRWAARGGHLEAVRALLDAGADVNQKSYTGWTALMEAVLGSHEEVVWLLMQRGADVNATTFANASVMYFARDVVPFSPNPEAARRIIRLLEERGAVYSEPVVDED